MFEIIEVIDTVADTLIGSAIDSADGIFETFGSIDPNNLSHQLLAERPPPPEIPDPPDPGTFDWGLAGAYFIAIGALGTLVGASIYCGSKVIDEGGGIPPTL